MVDAPRIAFHLDPGYSMKMLHSFLSSHGFNIEDGIIYGASNFETWKRHCYQRYRDNTRQYPDIANTFTALSLLDCESKPLSAFLHSKLIVRRF